MARLLLKDPIKITKDLEELKKEYNRDQRVEFICPICKKSFTRFLRFVKSKNEKCSNCQKIETFQENYGVSNASQLPDHYEKCKKKYIKTHGSLEDYNRYISEKRNQTLIEKYGSLEEYERQRVKKMKCTNLERYGDENLNHVKEIRDKRIQTCIEKYGVENPFAAEEVKEKLKKTFLEKYGVENVSQAEEIKKKKEETTFKHFGVKNPLQSKEIQNKSKKTCIEKYGAPYYFQSEECLRQNYSKRKKLLFNNEYFDSKWELAFYIYCKDHNIKIIRNYSALTFYVNKEEHKYYPDFIVDDKYVEIKGPHFLTNDGKLQDPYKRVPQEVLDAKYKCMQEHKVEVLSLKECKKYVNYVNEKYTKDFLGLFKLSTPFPEILGGNKDDDIIKMFHKSIYDAKVNKKPSPKEAWNDKSLVYKAALNRLKYVGKCTPKDIVGAFSIMKLAPKVSVFKVKTADNLIKKYLNNVNEIFDPFSGFSARMLGASKNNKVYIGQDINKVHVKESNEIIKYLKLCNVSVSIGDAKITKGSYESLFTCPPYGLKEIWNENENNFSCDEWIDLCLKNFKCKKYLFVIDDTKKYKDFIVETLENKSHFNTNYEKIVYIESPF